MRAPVALVTLVDVERQWFKSCIGLDETETATNISFCAHAIAAGDEPMVVADATIDPRFKANRWSPASTMSASTRARR